jgi:hypothetical protein
MKDAVIPAQAGIQHVGAGMPEALDSRLRGNDDADRR